MTEVMANHFLTLDDQVALKNRAYNALNLFQSSEPCDYMFSCVRNGLLADSDKHLGKFVISRRIVRREKDGPLSLYYREEHNDGSGYYGMSTKVMEIDKIEIMLDCMLIMQGRTRTSDDAELDTYTSEYIYFLKGEDYDTGLRPHKAMPPRPDPLLYRLYEYLDKMEVRGLLEGRRFATMELATAMYYNRKAKDIIGKKAVKLMKGCFLSQCAPDWRGWEDWCISYKQYHRDIEQMVEIAKCEDMTRNPIQKRIEDY